MTNPYLYILCIIPLAIALAGPLITIASVIGKMNQRRQIDDGRERALAIREADAMRRRELHEAKIAAVNNAVVLQDAKLELEQLKIMALKHKLGIVDNDFQTEDYSSDPTALS